MFVKICGITTVEDALLAVEAGARALGFNFYARSPRYVTPQQAALIGAALPKEVWKVGVFVNETPAAMMQIARAARLDVVQLHGHEPPEDVPSGIRAWKALRVGEDFSPEQACRYPVEAILLDAPSGASFGGSGTSFAWEQVPRLAQRVILAGGLEAGNVAEAIRLLRPWGVDACSRLECAPGRKDPHKLRLFIQTALAAS